jgi:hypothetical protein
MASVSAKKVKKKISCLCTFNLSTLPGKKYTTSRPNKLAEQGKAAVPCRVGSYSHPDGIF